MKAPKLTAIILTYNEEQHLPRCLASLDGVADSILVADSFSTDKTVFIAENNGATVIQHSWTNHSTQFNWALSQIELTEWILRLDADEYLTPELQSEIREKISSMGNETAGIFCGRQMIFQGRLIKHGGLFPIRVLRLFRYGKGQCEKRWMDEHIKVSGPTADFKGNIIDHNLNPLSWWIDKHNHYASREAVDLLNLKYKFMPHDSIATFSLQPGSGSKRWIKENIYAALPGGFRAFAYFFYRYFIRFGFLDGKAGMTFHFLQAFWYRFLVDAKMAEVEQYMSKTGCSATRAIKEILFINVQQTST